MRGQKLDTIVQDLMEELDTEWFDAKTIQAGFANTGIWLYDCKSIELKFQNHYMWVAEKPVTTDTSWEVKDMAISFKELLFEDATPKNQLP